MNFKELYEFLQSYEKDNIISWLEESWKGKDKQESLLRLFSGLELIPKINNHYDVCKGNFNLQTILPLSSKNDIFYDSKGDSINLKDKGNASDLTCISKYNQSHLLVTTSKNIKNGYMQVGNLDIDKIESNFQEYKKNGYTMSLCVCIRKNEDYQAMIKNIEKTNKRQKLLLEKDDTIVIDWNDLNQAYHEFKIIFSATPLKSIIHSNKNTLVLKLHQHLTVQKTLKMKKDKVKNILWGHIQRSGKSYIIGGCIIEDSLYKNKCNYLVITTAPNETIEQQRKVFDCLQLENFKTIVLNRKTTSKDLGDKNIIICSKQFLDNKNYHVKITKSDKQKTIKKYLKNDGIIPEKTYSEQQIIDFMNKYDISNEEVLEDKEVKLNTDNKLLKKLSGTKFDMRFVDESHNGGTTKLAQKTLNCYGKNSFTVQITATYFKPVNNYKIDKKNWLLWDLEDIKLCKNIKKDGSNGVIDRLVEKHGEEIRSIINKYTMDNIVLEYSKYPELWILSEKLDEEHEKKIINDTRDNNCGYSLKGCFLLKNNHKNETIEEFKNESEALNVWYRIFGKRNEYGISDKDFPDDKVIIKRIEKICKNRDIHSRFIGENELRNDPMVIMAFLPQNNVNKVSNATIKLLEKNNIVPEYDIISINSKITTNPKQTIEDSRSKAKINRKKGVIVLSGKQCSLGVSIQNCDIVLMLNNNNSFDLVYQMMFRSMTEAKNKKCGFVVDLNIHRVIETTLINYASMIKPDIHPKEAIKYILQEKLIVFNGDHYISSFGNNNMNRISSLCDSIYNVYSSNMEKVFKHYLDRLSFNEENLSKEEKQIFKSISNTTKNSSSKEKQQIEEKKETIKEGIEKEYNDKENEEEKESNNEDEKNDDDEEEKKIDYIDILKCIIPLICLLTIHSKETSFFEMFKYIENNEYIYNILIEQTKSWWGKNINSFIIKSLISIYNKCMENQTNQVIRTIKEVFIKNINNRKELSKIIDKYLIPQEIEKKTNAEISTPYSLRKEMLDKIPRLFWTGKRIKKDKNTGVKTKCIIYPKVFEPCSGKGGFILDIIDRFMEGLKDVITDEKKRYKIIVEKCLYFSDINSVNIFICKLLIDPYNEYNLNYNEGDTLELDIKKKWGINGFDAVIGNPPYQAPRKKENKTKGGGGDLLWNKFVIKSINEWLLNNCYLLYVHPSGWRKPEGLNITSNSKYKGLYELMTKKNQLLYLNINNTSEGMKIFNCGTRFDYYLLKKKPIYRKTKINDEENKKILINLEKIPFLPNKNILTISSFLSINIEDNISVLRPGSDTRRDYISDTKSDIYKYTMVHSTPNNGIKYKYCIEKKNKDHFGIPKIIIGETGFSKNMVLDKNGDYGITCCSFGIKIINDDFDKIKNTLNSSKFKLFLDSCSWGNYRIDWRLFMYLKKDFWKGFI